MMNVHWTFIPISSWFWVHRLVFFTETWLLTYVQNERVCKNRNKVAILLTERLSNFALNVSWVFIYVWRNDVYVYPKSMAFGWHVGTGKVG